MTVEAASIAECLRRVSELTRLSVETISDCRTANKFLDGLNSFPGWHGSLGWKNEGPFSCTITGPTGKICTAEDEDVAVAIYNAALMHLSPGTPC